MERLQMRLVLFKISKNQELESIRRDHFDEKELNELLYDVRQSIGKSVQKLSEGR